MFLSLQIVVELSVQNIGDEHVAGGVGDDDGGLGILHCRLGGHAAGPEHRHLTGADLHRIAVVGLHHVLDADLLRVANLHRGPVDVGHLHGDVIGLLGQSFLKIFRISHMYILYILTI